MARGLFRRAILEIPFAFEAVSASEADLAMAGTISRYWVDFVGWQRVTITAHFFDSSPKNIRILRETIETCNLRLPEVVLDIRPLDFKKAFENCFALLADPQAAKLIFIDQFGVDQVTPEVFLRLVNFPTADFLFFLSSSTLHRFRDHPAIKQKISQPNDGYHVHRAAFEYYHDLLPDADSDYFLAPFSIRKGSNIYGLIFGSAHILGILKFLKVAWNKDAINGEANFDINREDLSSDQMVFSLDAFRPTKVTAFESELERRLRSGQLRNEEGLLRFCLCSGFTPKHAESVLTRLKAAHVIEASFRVPQHGQSRSISLI